MLDLIKAHKNGTLHTKANTKADYFEPIVQTRKENKISDKQQAKGSGLCGRYNLAR